VVEPADERSHPPGAESLWNESWYFDVASDDGSLGGYVRIGRYPNLGVVSYWACLVGVGRPLVTVIDHEVPLPAGDSLELRADGLWADHNCEEPLARWSLGLEAFAVSMDDPTEVYRGGYGDRIPFGFDLEWETDGEPFGYPAGLDRYEIPCRVHGEVLVGDERLELAGPGQRDHSWGVRDWWATEWCWTAFHLDDGSHWHGVVILPEQAASIGYVQRPGQPLATVSGLGIDVDAGTDGLANAVRFDVDGVEVSFTPTAWAPVLLVSPTGRRSRFARGYGRFRTAAGADGLGWLELNQPDQPE
jgi:hypothetical protein